MVLKSKVRNCSVLFAGLLLFLSSQNTAYAKSTDLLRQQNSIELVEVKDANNTADSTGLGKVNYDYYIGKYEITNAQYVQFLNAVAKTDQYGLYNKAMGQTGYDSYGFICRGGIKRTGSSGSYVYTVIEGRENKPVCNLSIMDAAYYCNWLNSGSIEIGVYNKLTTGKTLKEKFERSADAVKNGAYALPTENEWYKAAFYSPKKYNGSGGYWRYPLQVDVMDNSKTYMANFNGGVTTDLKNVGSYNYPTYYGTYDQAGNAGEFTQTFSEYNSWDSTESSISRGGCLTGCYNYLPKTENSSYYSVPIMYKATEEYDYVGFRVVYVQGEDVEALESVDSNQQPEQNPSTQPTISVGKNNDVPDFDLKKYANQTIFAEGVSKEEGWYDNDKLSASGISAPDNSYCWASTVSGWAQWMQDRMVEEGWSLPTNITNGKGTNYSTAIFEKFVKEWNNTGSGGKTNFGLDWYMWGKYVYQDTSNFMIDNPINKSDKGPGTLYQILENNHFSKDKIEIEVTTDKAYNTLENYLIKTSENHIEKSVAFQVLMGYEYAQFGYKSRYDYFSKTVIHALKNGGVVAVLPNQGGHVINLWGVDTDENGNVSRVYITDSDDPSKYGKNKLIAHDLKVTGTTLSMEGYYGNGGFGAWHIFYKLPYSRLELEGNIETPEKHEHVWDSGVVTTAPTCTNSGIKTYHCTGSECQETKTKTIDASGHSLQIIKEAATMSANGVLTYQCRNCDYHHTKEIAKISSVMLSESKYIYDGKVKTPKVTVKDANGKLLDSKKDYDTTYSTGRKNAGKYTVKVTFKGEYAGTKSVVFVINPLTQNVKITSNTKTVNYKTVKNKSVSTSEVSVTGAKGSKKFSKVGGSDKLTINSTTGKIVVKKGTKKGTYSIKVKVTSKATTNYKQTTSAVKTIKVVVK